MTDTPALPLLLTARQVAEALGITPRSVRTLHQTRRIAHIRVAGRIMFPRQAVDDFIRANTVAPERQETKQRVRPTTNAASYAVDRTGKPNVLSAVERAERIKQRTLKLHKAKKLEARLREQDE